MKSTIIELDLETVDKLTGIDEQTRELLKTIVATSYRTGTTYANVTAVDGMEAVSVTITVLPRPGRYSNDPCFNQWISQYRKMEAQFSAYLFNLGLLLPLMSREHSQFLAMQSEFNALKSLVESVTNRRKIFTIDGNIPSDYYSTPFTLVADHTVPGVEFTQPEVTRTVKVSADFDLPYANDIIDVNRWQNVDRVPTDSGDSKSDEAV